MLKSLLPDLPEPRLVARWALTLALGALGGVVAKALGLPLPWMLGALFATGIAAATHLRILGAPPAFPVTLRMGCVPVIGVLIGSAFTADVLASLPGWWPTLLAVLVFVPLAHGIGYAALRHAGGYDRATAYFAAMPGGLVEAIELGQRHGAEMRALTALQFARIALVVTALPLAFSLSEGHAVGSAAGVSFGSRAALSLSDALILIACGVLGAVLARRLRLPAAMIIGPMLASALAHGMGWTHAAPPGWLVAGAQLVIGTTLGLRFVGLTGRELARHMGFSALNVALLLALGAAFGAVIAAAGGPGPAVMLLSLAPGGLVEMGLVALSLGANAIFVTAHHLVRVIFTVLFAVIGWRWLDQR